MYKQGCGKFMLKSTTDPETKETGLDTREWGEKEIIYDDEDPRNKWISVKYKFYLNLQDYR